MAKAGRPKLDIRKEQNVCFRLTKDEYDRLKEYASSRNQTVTKLLHECVTLMISEEPVRDLRSNDERRKRNGIKKGSKGKSS